MLMNDTEFEKIYGRKVIEVEYYNSKLGDIDTVELVLFSAEEDALDKVVFWGYRHFNGIKHTYHIFRDIKTPGAMLDKFFEEIGLTNAYTLIRPA